MKDLEVKTRNEVDEAFIKARSLINSGEKSQGLTIAEDAWSKIPEPKFEWDVSLSFTQSMARFYRDSGLYEKAINIIDELKKHRDLEDYQEGPIFTLGTIYFEKKDFDQAYKFFDEANKISRGRCFRHCHEKYREFYKTRHV